MDQIQFNDKKQQISDNLGKKEFLLYNKNIKKIRG